MSERLQCVSPIDGSVYVERDYASEADVAAAVLRAREAQEHWRLTPLAERQALLSKAVDAFVAKGEAIAEEITRQMGRPLAHSPKKKGSESFFFLHWEATGTRRARKMTLTPFS